MSRLWVIGCLLAAAMMPWQAEAAMHWQPAPKKHAHGGHDRSAGKAFVLVAGEGASVSLIDPYLDSKPLDLAGQKVVVKSTGKGNYHALVAKREHVAGSESAVRYVYMHGRPPGTSPADITALDKSLLEIEPAPLAREHWRYYSGTEASFILRFQGHSLPFTDVVMTTANGTTATFKTDDLGRLTVLIPEDFTDVQAGRSNNRPSEFVLQASHSDINQLHTTTFSSDYFVNPNHWQSTMYGLVVVIGGMLIGWLLVRRKRKEKS